MNQNQITMTRGDDRSLAFVIDDEYEGDTATLIVDGLFDKSVTVGADDGSGYATATFDVTLADTEDEPDWRRSYKYELSVSHDGDRRTIRRGLFVLVGDLDAVDS